MSDELRAGFSLYNMKGVEWIAAKLRVPLTDDAGVALTKPLLIEQIIRLRPIELHEHFQSVNPSELDPAVLAAEIGRTAAHEGRHIQGQYLLLVAILGAVTTAFVQAWTTQPDEVAGGVPAPPASGRPATEKPVEHEVLKLIPTDLPPTYKGFEQLIGIIDQALDTGTSVSSDLVDKGYVELQGLITAVKLDDTGAVSRLTVAPTMNAQPEHKVRCYLDMRDQETLNVRSVLALRIKLHREANDENQKHPVIGHSIFVHGPVAEFSPVTLVAGITIQPARLSLDKVTN